MNLLEVLAKHHSIFSLEGERGETSLVEFAIDTGDTVPKKLMMLTLPLSYQNPLMLLMFSLVMINNGVIVSCNQ